MATDCERLSPSLEAANFLGNERGVAGASSSGQPCVDSRTVWRLRAELRHRPSAAVCPAAH